MEGFGNYPRKRTPEQHTEVASIVDAIPEIERIAEGMRAKAAEVQGVEAREDVEEGYMRTSPDLGRTIAEVEKRNATEM